LQPKSLLGHYKETSSSRPEKTAEPLKLNIKETEVSLDCLDRQFALILVQSQPKDLQKLCFSTTEFYHL